MGDIIHQVQEKREDTEPVNVINLNSIRFVFFLCVNILQKKRFNEMQISYVDKWQIGDILTGLSQ